LQSKYYPKSVPKWFNTNKCSIENFEKLARNTCANSVKYDRISIDQIKAIVQTKVQNVIIDSTRVDTLETRRVNLDYKVKEPGPSTHVDIKCPVDQIHY